MFEIDLNRLIAVVVHRGKSRQVDLREVAKQAR
jgi:hypothetical protein